MVGNFELFKNSSGRVVSKSRNESLNTDYSIFGFEIADNCIGKNLELY